MVAAKKFNQMAAKFVILLPPSESKAEHGRPRTKWKSSSGEFGKQFSGARDELIRAIDKVGGGNAAILGAKGALLERAKGANRSLVGAPTLPAFERYSGVVWKHMDLESMTSAQRAKALEHIVVISGLLGAVGGADPVPNYRLKMSANLAPMGTLSRWWQGPLSEVLNERLSGCAVVDLLPQIHRLAYAPDLEVLGDYLRIEIDEVGGNAGGHDAKAAKGRLARHILDGCTSGVNPRGVLETFRDPRFHISIKT